MKLLPTSDYHEEYGDCLFFSFSRDKNNKILGEAPDVKFSSGYIEYGFDETIWTHFIKGESFNFIFTEADPITFPK